MRRPIFATLMTFRKPMWHHTKIKHLIQEIKNYVCSVCGRAPSCMNHCVYIGRPVPNVSEWLLHSLFLHKTIQLSPFDLQSTRPLSANFTNLWHLSHFPWNTAFTRTFATSTLWCYNVNGMIKWYDISCATLYVQREGKKVNISLWVR